MNALPTIRRAVIGIVTLVALSVASNTADAHGYYTGGPRAITALTTQVI